MTQRVILAGGGHAHLAVLADWAAHFLPDTERWLITSARHTAYSGMLPGWMAGIYPAKALLIDLEPLARKSGAKLVLADVVGLDADAKTLTLSTGEDLAFDLLSLGTGGETNSDGLGALGERLLTVRPVDRFMARWTAFLGEQSASRRANIAIVGGGAGGVELALGAKAALPLAHVALICSEHGLLAGHNVKARERAQQELERRGILIHHARATGTAQGVELSTGEHISADLVIVATGSRAPAWLAQSGLACTAEGFVAVKADMRSPSHPSIFAAGDIIGRTDRKLERSGVHAVKAGPVLAANLRAALGGTTLKTYNPPPRTLYLLALGDKRAILSWGGVVLAGRWVWRLKDWIDRRFVRRYRQWHDHQ